MHGDQLATRLPIAQDPPTLAMLRAPMLASRSRVYSSLGSRRYLSSLLVAEHDGKTISEGTLAAVTACSALRPTTVSP